MNFLISLSPIVKCFVAFLSSLLLCALAIPKIIILAEEKHLFDVPDARKHHSGKVSSLGGSAIFFSFIICSSLLISTQTFTMWNYYVVAALMILIVGLKDDIIAVAPGKKFAFQFGAAFSIVCLADVRLNSFFGIFGIYEVAPFISYIFCTIGVMFVTNAFNLIDGIDGLAGTIGLMSCALLGLILFFEGNYGASILAYSLMGAIAGFLRYNVSPAKIFMGDTGSLIIGFTVSLLAIMCVNSYKYHPILHVFIHNQASALLVVAAVLMLPVFDAFRVFFVRLMRGKSPFSADRTHVHHFLLAVGMSHNQAVFTLSIYFVIMISMAILMQTLPITVSLGILIICNIIAYATLQSLVKANINTKAAAQQHLNMSKSIPLNANFNMKMTKETK